MNMLRANRKQDGFTLIELMITLVIAVILAMIAVPAFNNTIQRNRIATKTNTLVTFLATARSEAVKLGKPVTICASSNGTSCSGGNFNDGWIVFIDTGTAGTVDGTDKILNVQEKLTGGINVTFTPPAGVNYLQFLPNGMLTSACGQCVQDFDYPLFTESNQTPGLTHSLIAALLPWGTAHASPGNSGATGDPSGTTGDPSGATGGSSGATGGSGTPLYTYILCDKNNKVKGQSVQVYGTGRVRSQPYDDCPQPP